MLAGSFEAGPGAQGGFQESFEAQGGFQEGVEAEQGPGGGTGAQIELKRESGACFQADQNF